MIGESLPTTVRKRNGDYVPANVGKIKSALTRCFSNLDKEPNVTIDELVNRVEKLAFSASTVDVEEIQNIVEMVLQNSGEYDAAKAYILYRDEQRRLREENPIPDDVRSAFEESKKYFPTPLQEFQFYSTYSRYNYDLGRRETWIETIDRAVNYMRELSENKLHNDVYQLIRENILSMNVFPSMRLLSMAGEPARRNSSAIYNCTYLTADAIDAFVEALLLSMAGCGVGYSVEEQYVSKLPTIKPQTGKHLGEHIIEDSAEGWGDAYRLGLETWFSGKDIDFDYSEIRLAGAPLKTKGGRASGPLPLFNLLTFARDLILRNQGLRLRPIHVHDLFCETGQAAISGGVRRTALIAFFDKNDKEMLNCKSNITPENYRRFNANNSIVFNTEPTQEEIIEQFSAMFAGKMGEPGIHNRYSAQKNRPKRRKNDAFGGNPCMEINLKSQQMCNLSTVICKPDDTQDMIRHKVQIATIIGTIQSLSTNFPGLRQKWVDNAIEERLLGVSLSSQLDCPVVQDAEFMKELKEAAIETNKEYAEKFGINPSTSITCVKPDGNSSVLADSAPGIHPRWAPYYIRRVRIAATSPVFKLLKKAGVPLSPENGQSVDNATTWVASFPSKSPEGTQTRGRQSVIEQCEYWLMNKLYWTEHNPSVTIYYKNDEMLDLLNWVWEHRNVIGGMSFLPYDDSKYEQMPYEEITKEQYEKLSADFPSIDFSKIWLFEREDMSTASSEKSCFAGECLI